jgi:L-asparaginase
VEPNGRKVSVLAAGGTIAMRGERAVPALDAEGLLAAVPELARAPGLTARTVVSLPGAQMTLPDALAVAQAAAAEAHGGRGVVVTHGTDTLEESALLCDLVYDGDAPIAFTGAIRPGSRTSADGPGNLLDAVAVAASDAAAGMGALVVFGGEVHSARHVRKDDSAGPAAFASPTCGPLGRVVEGRVAVALRPARRRPALDVRRLDLRVPIVATALGDDGSLLAAAAEDGADGIVLVALGGGHVGPAVLEALRFAAARVPVVVALRPSRGAFLASTYGFEGAEDDVRATGAIPAGALSAQAARVQLLACLGAGLERDRTAAFFAPDDP